MTVFAFSNPNNFDDAHTLYRQVSETPLRPATELTLNRRYANSDGFAFARFVLQWRAAFPDQKCEGTLDASGAGYVPNRHALRMLGAYNVGGCVTNKISRNDAMVLLHDINMIVPLAGGIERSLKVQARMLSRS